MPKDDTVYLAHTLETAQRANAKASRISKEQFDANEVVQLALAHLVQIIGEAAAHVSEQGCRAHPEIPWREITGIRNKIVHDYLGVDIEVVWQVATEDLPPLIETLKRTVTTDN